jgi:hypothetical protein
MFYGVSAKHISGEYSREGNRMALGLLKRFFTRSNAPSKPIAREQDVIRLAKGGFFEVVGEAQYQKELEEICGGRDVYSAEHQCLAILVPEPNNPADPNAIQIVIERRVVAYLARQHAIEYHQHIGMKPSCCDAKIVGGWDDGKTIGHFGVKLKIKWPPKSRKS